jgi:uncharacterized cupin superfamily protein
MCSTLTAGHKLAVEHATNVWAELEDFGEGVSGRRLERIRGETLAAAVWELAPGATGNTYHFHHGTREWLLVLRGRLSLRTHEGERDLSEGDVLAFPRGRDGAHGVANRSDEPVRYLVVAQHDSPDVIEYPDEGTLGVFALSASEDGEPLGAFFRAADAFERD